jgi:hypothetical protein
MGDGLDFADRSEVWVNVRGLDDHRDAFSARVAPLRGRRLRGPGILSIPIERVTLTMWELRFRLFVYQSRRGSP